MKWGILQESRDIANSDLRCFHCWPPPWSVPIVQNTAKVVRAKLAGKEITHLPKVVQGQSDFLSLDKVLEEASSSNTNMSRFTQADADALRRLVHSTHDVKANRNFFVSF